MSSLTLTLSSAFSNPARAYAVPLANGEDARTEIIAIPAATAGASTGTLICAADENCLELVADADCWVAIGATPDPEAASDGTRAARLLKSGIPYQYRIREGSAVAVVEA